MVEAHMIFNVFMYAIVIAYILYINFATYYNSGTNFLNFLIKLFNNWVFRLIFLLVVGFFALDLFPYGGFIFAILLTIAFLNTNMLVYKKQMSESFESRNPINPASYETSAQEEKSMDGPDLYVRNDSSSLLEPMGMNTMEDQGSLLGETRMYGE
jgi:hypothetical protein